MLRKLATLQLRSRVVDRLVCSRPTKTDRKPPEKPNASPDRTGRLAVIMVMAGLLAACAGDDEGRAYSLSGKYIAASNVDEYYQRDGEWSGVASEFTRVIMSGHWVSENKSPTSKSICVTVERSNFKPADFVGKTICRTMEFESDKKIRSYHFLSPTFPAIFEVGEISE